MKLLYSMIYKEENYMFVILPTSLLLIIASTISMYNRNVNTQELLNNISSSSIDDLVEFQNKSIENKKTKDYNQYLQIKSIDSKHINYSYNINEESSKIMGVNLIKHISDSPYINKIQTLRLNGVEIPLDKIQNVSVFQEVIEPKILDAENKNKDSFKTIHIELK